MLVEAPSSKYSQGRPILLEIVLENILCFFAIACGGASVFIGFFAVVFGDLWQ